MCPGGSIRAARLRGATEHWSDPEAIRRELTALRVRRGERVYEVGPPLATRARCSAGPAGQVVSVDVSDHLTRCAIELHEQRGISPVQSATGDGLTERRADVMVDRIAVWCTPARLPNTLVDQLAPDGRIVVCRPIARLPSLTPITTITLDPDRFPQVETLLAPRAEMSVNGHHSRILTAQQRRRPLRSPLTLRASDHEPTRTRVRGADERT